MDGCDSEVFWTCTDSRNIGPKPVTYSIQFTVNAARQTVLQLSSSSSSAAAAAARITTNKKLDFKDDQ